MRRDALCVHELDNPLRRNAGLFRKRLQRQVVLVQIGLYFLDRRGAHGLVSCFDD